MKASEVFIGIAAHKEYQMPNNSIYYPIHVGSYNKELIGGYLSDAEGDNISKHNANFCELTATYYIWKNVNADYKGLVHYRRHFTSKKSHSDYIKGKFSEVLDEKKLLTLLEDYDVILPTKRKYFIETLYSHYKHSHEIMPLDQTRIIIEEIYPMYLDSFDKIMIRRSAHMFNMFIMKHEYFNTYCEWLFSILFELQNTIDISKYDEQEARVFGYISELLLDVWLEENKVRYKEIPVMFMEQQNWFIKGKNFLMNKFGNKSAEKISL
ncbi:DUF4422 domain-containing protein [Enterococcus sp. AZ163]|uniref:DUF4422 domain-containing protein n=1 Tax=Enterococcus sp. AZ163 TaxID=2774638 RepID=UPI003D2BD946